MKIRRFQDSDIDQAAGLLARAQIRYRSLAPDPQMLAACFEEPEACRPLIERLFAGSRTRGAAAESDGRLTGFLLGEKQLFGPTEFGSIYAEPHSVGMPLHGHAIAEDADPHAVYPRLYGELAEHWVDEGFFVHTVGIPSMVADVEDAWLGTGFGRKSVCAVREVDSDPAVLVSQGGRRDDVCVERLVDADDEIMETFHRDLMTYQTAAPMFWPYDGEQDANVRNVRRALLENGDGFCFAARVEGEPAGSMLFTTPVFLSPLLVPETMLYLWEGYVAPSHRSSGVGAALLASSLDLLRERGHRWCALHFVSGNILGGSFWLRNGFKPVEHTLRRHVDERVAWARGPGSKVIK